MKIAQVVLFVMTIGLTLSQRTSLRSCDCEYTVDGRCAYTLMLPLANQEGATPYCPQRTDVSSNNNTNDVAANERLNDIEASVQSLDANLTQVNQWTMQNAQLLSVLQNRVMTIQERVGIINESDYTMQDTSSGNAAMNQSIASLQSQADRQADRIDTLADSVNNIANDVTTLRSDYNTLETRLATATDDYQRLSASYATLNNELSMKSQELESLKNTVDSYKSAGLLCRQRGLLVEGPNQTFDVNQVQVSSVYDANHGADKVRMQYTPGTGPGSWCPRE